MNAILSQRYFDAPEPEPVEDISASRPACDAMKALKQHEISPAVVAHLLSVLSATVARAGWSHTCEAEHVRQEFDDLADFLNEAE